MCFVAWWYRPASTSPSLPHHPHIAILRSPDEETAVTEATSEASCALCGRPTYDPDKREPPWARGVSRGRLVLVCPACRRDRPAWEDMLDRCGSCGSTRLSVALGHVTCRACGHTAEGR